MVAVPKPESDMSWTTPDWLARVPRAIRVLIGVPLVVVLMSSLLASGEEIAAEGIWFAIMGLAASLLLLTASIRNWPLLWNALGILLRALLGERGARVAFGLAAVAFMLPCLMRTSVAIADSGSRQLDSVSHGRFPLDVTDTSSVEIRLARSACFGTCPVYTLVIRGDGAVAFDGGEREAVLAPPITQLSPAQVAGLLEAFERVDYQKLGDYSSATCNDRTDAPSVTTSLRHDGQEKVVVRYAGCDRAPEALTRLEWAIDSIAGVGAQARESAG